MLHTGTYAAVESNRMDYSTPKGRITVDDGGRLPAACLLTAAAVVAAAAAAAAAAVKQLGCSYNCSRGSVSLMP